MAVIGSAIRLDPAGDVRLDCEIFSVSDDAPTPMFEARRIL
jgi:hypothetical protein